MRSCAKFSPWWDGADSARLAPATFHRCWNGSSAPARRMVLLTGGRRVSKTTLLLQVADRLIEAGRVVVR